MDSGKLEMEIKCLNAMELIVKAPLVHKDSMFESTSAGCVQ